MVRLCVFRDRPVPYDDLSRLLTRYVVRTKVLVCCQPNVQNDMLGLLFIVILSVTVQAIPVFHESAAEHIVMRQKFIDELNTIPGPPLLPG